MNRRIRKLLLPLLAVGLLRPFGFAQVDTPTSIPPPSAQATTSTIIQINIDDPASADGSPIRPIDPANPPAFDIVPPLSVYESRLMIRDVEKQLRETPPEALAARIPRLDYMLGAVARYIRWVDETHTTLPAYQWEDQADFKMRSSLWRQYTFTMHKPLANVTAIALHAHHDDIEIQQISIVDKQRRQWNFNRSILIKADQPGNEICFLPLPTEIAMFMIRCRQVVENETDRPRLFISTGVSARPESAKAAVYYLQLARHDLGTKANDSALRNMTLADQKLYEYQKDRSL